MGAVVAWIARVVGSVFGLKFFMSGVFMTIGGIILYNFLVDVVEEVMNFALTQINGVSTEGITSPTITGFAGWFLAQIKMPECFAVMVTCITIRFVLRKIPFLKW